jgi:2-C-methyl-D-erythritol 2,4-cyclodiphosphate synthase
MYKVGSGIDFHQLVEGRDLWLGGVKVPHYKGALGHSDADVLLHAICDALLGALSLGDIGVHFPDTDAAFKNIDSKILLERSFDLVKDKGYSIENVDAMLCLEKPKIKPFVPEMRARIAGILCIDEDSVSIKATTTEKLGFTGREEGVVALATVLLKQKDMPLLVPVVSQSAFPLPEYATSGSSGLDLRANITEPIELGSLERTLVPTGLFLQIPAGHEAQVRPRSGLAIKQGLTVLNSPGTIDSDYRGEVKVILVNLGTATQMIQPGDRIAQMVFQRIETIAWQQVDKIEETKRSTGGFGHSGIL